MKTPAMCRSFANSLGELFGWIDRGTIFRYGPTVSMTIHIITCSRPMNPSGDIVCLGPPFLLDVFGIRAALGRHAAARFKFVRALLESSSCFCETNDFCSSVSVPFGRLPESPSLRIAVHFV